MVATDLLTGVLLGVALSASKLAYTASHLRAAGGAGRGTTGGPAAPGRVGDVPEPATAGAGPGRRPVRLGLHVELDELLFIDHSCLHLLTEWEKQHRATGGWLTLDQDGLRARFDRPGRHGRGGRISSVAVG